MTSREQDVARAFRRLHEEGLLVLPNVWDAGSARLIESLGAKALATTSAGMAWSHGYADGDRLPVRLLLATVAEIARVVRVPLSVDVEGGYANDPAAVGETVGLPPATELEALGVRRLSAGSGIAEVVFAKTASLAAAFLRAGASDPLAEGAMPYQEINALIPGPGQAA